MKARGLDLAKIIADPKATGIASNYPDDHDPVRLGPGYWDRLTLMAWEARTAAKQKDACDEFRYTCRTFPCTVCQGHCHDYVDQHPPEEFIGKEVMVEGVSEPIGLFVWIWQFHNAVNLRLGKPKMSFATAIEKQTSRSQCSTACKLSEHAVPSTTGTSIGPSVYSSSGSSSGSTSSSASSSITTSSSASRPRTFVEITTPDKPTKSTVRIIKKR